MMLRCDGRFRARYRGTACARCDGIITRGLWIYGWTGPSGKVYTHEACVDGVKHRGDLVCANCWGPMVRGKATWDTLKGKRIDGPLRCFRRCSITTL